MNIDYPIIDADGHVMEKDAELREFLEGRYREGPHFQTYSFFPSLDGWNRGFGVPGKIHETPASKWLEFLDELGVHTTVLYPTGGLALGLIQNPEWSCVISRAYNSWIAERFTKQSQRLKGVALLPVHEPTEAAKELERAKGLGLIAGLMPAVTVLNKGYGHTDFDPIYEAAEKLDMPLTVHGAPSRGMGFDFFNKFLHVHTLEHPFAILVQFTHIVFEGVFVRFPRLRVAFLEAGSGWLPYMMDRMDEEFEPSEYIRSGQVWATCEVEEKALPHVLKQFNPKCLMWPSDYPHERLPDMFSHDLPEFLGRTDIGDDTKKAILHDNPINFYRLKL
jgi:predicted TIM-barrel fold metal-dependent hydrolase